MLWVLNCGGGLFFPHGKGLHKTKINPINQSSDIEQDTTYTYIFYIYIFYLLIYSNAIYFNLVDLSGKGKWEAIHFSNAKHYRRKFAEKL